MNLKKKNVWKVQWLNTSERLCISLHLKVAMQAKHVLLLLLLFLATIRTHERFLLNVLLFCCKTKSCLILLEPIPAVSGSEVGEILRSSLNCPKGSKVKRYNVLYFLTLLHSNLSLNNLSTMKRQIYTDFSYFFDNWSNRFRLNTIIDSVKRKEKNLFKYQLVKPLFILVSQILFWKLSSISVAGLRVLTEFLFLNWYSWTCLTAWSRVRDLQTHIILHQSKENVRQMWKRVTDSLDRLPVWKGGVQWTALGDMIHTWRMLGTVLTLEWVAHQNDFMSASVTYPKGQRRSCKKEQKVLRQKLLQTKKNRKVFSWFFLGTLP